MRIVVAGDKPVPELDRIVVLCARGPSILRMYRPPDVWSARDLRMGLIGAWGSSVFFDSNASFEASSTASRSLTGTGISSSL